MKLVLQVRENTDEYRSSLLNKILELLKSVRESRVWSGLKRKILEIYKLELGNRALSLPYVFENRDKVRSPIAHPGSFNAPAVNEVILLVDE
ncbi:hypothetical protein J6590_068553 [Homalodisca vitripennis]|nr:hypothetical protein J6590_068553 [Homalodisca vitripennis]